MTRFRLLAGCLLRSVGRCQHILCSTQPVSVDAARYPCFRTLRAPEDCADENGLPSAGLDSTTLLYSIECVEISQWACPYLRVCTASARCEKSLLKIRLLKIRLSRNLSFEESVCRGIHPSFLRGIWLSRNMSFEGYVSRGLCISTNPPLHQYQAEPSRYLWCDMRYFGVDSAQHVSCYHNCCGGLWTAFAHSPQPENWNRPKRWSWRVWWWV